MAWLKNSFCVVLLLELIGCDYSPTETNIKSIATPINNISVEVSNLNYINQIRGDVIINVESELKGHTLVEYKGYVDDRDAFLDQVGPNSLEYQIKKKLRK